MDDIVYSLAALEDDESGSLYIAGLASGLAVSADGGKTWQPGYESLGLEGALPTMSLAVSPGGEARQVLFAGVVGGVLSSGDGGKAWHVSQLPSPPPAVACLAVSPDYLHDSLLLAGTMEDGVFRSSDGGRTWNRWNFGLLDLNVLALALSPAFAEDETLYAGTETGIFRSTNAGRAWREVDFPMDLAPVLCLGISPNYVQDGMLLAGTESNGLHLSRDRGKTWQPVGSFGEESINAVHLQMLPGGALGFLVLAGGQLFYSDDSGKTWTEWEMDGPAEEGLSCILPLSQIEPGCSLLAGTVEGSIFIGVPHAIR